jgi:5'-nucleotidase
MEKKERPLILVTNDDGVTAKGIQSLVLAMANIGDVIVVAPDKPQSGMGHAVTIHHPIRITPVEVPYAAKAYACSGTPVDCVKIALYTLFDKKPDIIVSGINHGSNSSINVIYSGTMSAAVEGAVEGIPSVGFSLLDYDLDADFTASQKVAIQVVEMVLNDPQFPERICLNVNIPKGPSVAGIKICRQANGMWHEQFNERVDPFQKKYYWMTGEFKVKDQGEDTDDFALKNNFVSVVPVQFDLTAYHAISHLQQWNIHEHGNQ